MINFVRGYGQIRFGVNLQTYQTLVPTKNSHLKVAQTKLTFQLVSAVRKVIEFLRHLLQPSELRKSLLYGQPSMVQNSRPLKHVLT